MSRLTCDETYLKDLDEYVRKVFDRFSIFAPTGEREILCMANAGNLIALKLYADMVFYKKILRTHPYAEAFELYKKAAGIEFGENGELRGSEKAYPLAFQPLGYYLVTYRRDSYLKDCETIEEIEKMTLAKRLGCALELAIACITFVSSAEGVNLAGRVLLEASRSPELFAKLQDVIAENAADRTFPELGLVTGKCENIADCKILAETFLKKAAEEGYVYACNSLAAQIAGQIVNVAAKANDQADDTAAKADGMPDEVASSSDSATTAESLPSLIGEYIHYLKIAADRYEPYAANRLGLFYRTGEIKSHSGKAVFLDYVDYQLAKEYFQKATVYPDANSAWAFFNLQKYYPNDYIENIELMNEQIDYIKALNPNVYDLVMDL